MIHHEVTFSIWPIVQMRFQLSLALKMSLIDSVDHRQFVLDLDLPNHLIVLNLVAVDDFLKPRSDVLMYCPDFLLNLYLLFKSSDHLLI